MKIKGKVHLMFEQSGVFKNEFKKLGYEAYDYDIQDNFGETDFKIDLFAEIEKCYEGGESIFDSITCDDLVIAFFPCTYFSDMSQILHTWGAYPTKSVKDASNQIIERSEKRQQNYTLCIKMLTIAKERNIRLIMENPHGNFSYLKTCFVTQPTIIDTNRSLRGDEFMKPTAYWFINCTNTIGYSLQPRTPKRVKKDSRGCEERSMISTDYARNFICDFILGKEQKHTQLSLF